jgi:hypothetical protein
VSHSSHLQHWKRGCITTETSVPTHQIIPCHNPQEQTTNIRRRDSFRSFGPTATVSFILSTHCLEARSLTWTSLHTSSASRVAKSRHQEINRGKNR